MLSGASALKSVRRFRPLFLFFFVQYETLFCNRRHCGLSTALESGLGGRMTKDKRTIGVDVSEEVVTAFEAGIVFGRMVEIRRPKRRPLWSDDEWLQALIKAVGKEA